MAKVILKDVKKIYPHSLNTEKKSDKRAKNDQTPEHKANLQITEKGVVAVQEFNVEIADKEFFVLVGPSGCGKSTTLRMIAGLEEITEGELFIGDRCVNNIAPKDRDIAMVFQDYALYPHMTVYENMAFALKMRKMKKAEIDKKVREAAEILDITQYLNRKPKALSGGQRQRVAIGRAIVRNPQVFLMDEPLSNLDAKLRNQMRAELIKLRERIDTTFVYVTHDQTEAMTLGDRIVIMKDGFIQQIGTPQEVFESPSNKFSAGFIGTPQMNFFENARLVLDKGTYVIDIFGKRFAIPDDKQRLLKDKSQPETVMTIGVRPEHVLLTSGDEEKAIAAELDCSELLGSEMLLHLKKDGMPIVLRTPSTGILKANALKSLKETSLYFTFDENWIHLFDQVTEKSLLCEGESK